MPRFRPQEKIKVIWSPSFAYAIGLIASDGYLSSDRRHIGIKSADKELVEGFKRALALRNAIGRGVRGGESVKKYFHLQAGDVKFYRFLNAIGLTARKSKTIKAVAVPREFFVDFLRGLFDGDGTFYTFWDKRWPNSFAFQISFASASLGFVKWLKEKLTRLYSVRGFIRRGDGVFNVRYVKGDSKTLFGAMYYGRNLLFLKRKYSKIANALKQDEMLKKSRRIQQQ